MGIGAAIVLAGGAAVATSAVARASDTQETMISSSAQPEVALLTAIGSGCPTGLANATVTYDDGIEVAFDEMESVAATGTQTAATLQENCQLGLKVVVPDGITYAVSALTTQARATLAEGATAQVKQGAYVQGVSDTSYVNNDITGPVDGDLEITGSVAADSQVFAPCGEDRNLNVNTRLVLNTEGTTLAGTTNEVAVVGGMKISLTLQNC